MKTVVYICFLVSLFGLTSCGLVVKVASNSSVENEAIPPDFGKKGEILLCTLDLNEKKRNNLLLKKYVEEEYHGPVEFVSLSDLTNSKYRNKGKYRYRLFAREFHNGSAYSTKVSVIDQRTSSTYTCRVTSSFYGKLMKGYLRALEKKRLEEQGGN